MTNFAQTWFVCSSEQL